MPLFCILAKRKIPCLHALKMSLLTGPRCLAFIGKVVKTVRTAGVKAGYYRGIFYAISLFEIEE